MKRFTALLILLLAHAALSLETKTVLLVPGVGGSMLQTQSGDPVWISIERFLASYPNYENWGKLFSDYTDDAFRAYILGLYDQDGGIKPVFTNETLTTPNRLDRSECAMNRIPGALCGIEYLIDIPQTWWDSYLSEIIEWLLANADVDYFGDLIAFLRASGFKPGASLFGFPYDWRKSIRQLETLERLDRTLAKISNNGQHKVTVISHSMGCLVIKYYLSAYAKNAERFVDKWIAIGGPFHGAGGPAIAEYFSGYTFGNFEVCGCTARNLSVQSASSFELLANGWLENALGPVTLTAAWRNGSQAVRGVRSILDIAADAFMNHTFSYNGKVVPWSLCSNARDFGSETRRRLDSLQAPPSSVGMYVLYGTGLNTPYNVTYPVRGPDWRPADLLCEHAGCPQDDCIEALRQCEPTVTSVDGDGTVPALSASIPYRAESFLKQNITVHGVKGVSHGDLLKNRGDIFQTLRAWLLER